MLASIPSRNSRPELIADDERAWSSRRVPLPGLGIDQREVAGPAPGFGYLTLKGWLATSDR